MPEYFNHKLIFVEKNEKNIEYKCEKCNLMINHYNSDVNYENYGNNFYWAYNEMNPRAWYILTLTCEEEQIKAILE